MNKANYTRAKVYAYKASRDNYMDVVHDSYLKWYNKTGKDLFDENEALVVHVVKRTIQNQRSTDYFKKDFIKYKKSYYDYDEVYEEDKLLNLDNPMEMLTYDDITNLIKDQLTEKKMIIFDMMLAGYRITDIADKLGVSFHNAKFHVESIRDIYRHLN